MFISISIVWLYIHYHCDCKVINFVKCNVVKLCIVEWLLRKLIINSVFYLYFYIVNLNILSGKSQLHIIMNFDVVVMRVSEWQISVFAFWFNRHCRWEVCFLIQWNPVIMFLICHSQICSKSCQCNPIKTSFRNGPNLRSGLTS